MANRRGLALILVAGVLGLLAVLAAAFVTMAQLERKASLQRLYVTKAQLLARSGLEDAVARLSAGQDAALASTRYGGEDFDGSGTFSMMESDYEVYGPRVLDVETCPAKQAMRPSFFRKDTFGTLPDLVRVEGRLRGYTGQLKGDLVSGGNLYALKVEDESGKINVNGGFLDAQDRDDGGAVPDHRDTDVRQNPADPKDTGLGWNAQLVRILDVLGSQPEIGVPGLGTLALQNRPVGGYRSVKVLEQAVGTTKDLSPYLTVSSWSDTKVVHPNGYASQASVTNTTLSDVKKARVPLRPEEGGRPPVNLNAAHRAVLVALIQGLEGHTWHEPRFGSANAHLIPGVMAAGIADALLVFRDGQTPPQLTAVPELQPGPFRTWRQFSSFCDALAPTLISGMTVTLVSGMNVSRGGNLCGSDLLKANFDPNTMLNKELPDQLHWRWIDKSDLVVWSTEGSLGPTGTFKISSVGRVLDGRGTMLAEREASAMVEAFSLLRQTTQQDFIAGRSPPTTYLSLANPSSPGGNIPTTGASASWNPAGGGQGLAVVTYPCAPLAVAAGKAADFDGFIGLATVELGPSNPDNGQLLFLQHFDDGWDAEPVPGNPFNAPARLQPGPGTTPCDTCLAAAPESTWPASLAEPGTFYPDGAHAQDLRAPAYLAAGNFPVSWTSADPAPSNHGVVGFWVKPVTTYGPGFSISMSCVRGSAPATQAMAIGRALDCWGIMVENLLLTGREDTALERQCQVDFSMPNQAVLPGLRWQFAMGRFDTDMMQYGWDAYAAFRNVRGNGRTAINGYYPTHYNTGSGQDLLADSTMFALGGQCGDGDAQSDLQHASQVIDEFAICNFTDEANRAELASDAWVGDRYGDGRYYKGGDGRFLSAPLQPRPGASVRLLRAQWTEYLPRESRMQILHAYGVDPPPAGTSRLVDPILADDPVTGAPRAWLELELLDAGGTLTGPALRLLGQGVPIRLELPSFCYRVTFKTAIEQPESDPLLETPFLDDVTFFWQPMTGPRVLSWDAP